VTIARSSCRELPEVKPSPGSSSIDLDAFHVKHGKCRIVSQGEIGEIIR
jgi:hypothetical protein